MRLTRGGLSLQCQPSVNAGLRSSPVVRQKSNWTGILVWIGRFSEGTGVFVLSDENSDGIRYS